MKTQYFLTRNLTNWTNDFTLFKVYRVLLSRYIKIAPSLPLSFGLTHRPSQNRRRSAEVRGKMSG